MCSFTGSPGGFSQLAYNNLGETKCCCKIQKTHLVSPQPACFYMTRYRVFNFRLYSPMWIDFTNFINQVQLMLFAKYFLFFPPEESALISSFQIIDNLQSLHSVSPFQGSTPADLRTDGAKRIRIANRPCRLVQRTSRHGLFAPLEHCPVQKSASPYSFYARDASKTIMCLTKRVN